MAKTSSKYVCQQCGYESTKWFGKCPQCGEWNSAVETVTKIGTRQKALGTRDIKTGTEPVLLDSIPKGSTSRISTKISELDRVLGGGLVPGQVVLIAGEPGIGKSTLLLQVADQLSVLGSRLSVNSQSVVGQSVSDKQRTEKLETENRKQKTDNRDLSSVLYVSGEESISQIKIRADRLGIRNKNLQLLEETDVDSVIEIITKLEVGGGKLDNDVGSENKRKLSNFSSQNPVSHFSYLISAVIIDSIQTMSTSDLSGMAGSVGQVRECAFRLVRFAKENNVPVFLVGHVTKEGTVAGPSVLMHIVDTVLWFEGDMTLTTRILRAVKNRFGPTDEVGIFTMEDKGLSPLPNPEKIFLASGKRQVPGSTVTSILEGTRPILTEIQALVVPTKMAFPKRIAQGMDLRRFELLLAVLQRRAGLPLYEFDCFLNIAGGISIKNDPSTDLAVCLAVASAYFDKPLPRNSVALGEVGLLGDIREVVAQDKRIKQARRLGYSIPITSREVRYLQEGIKKYLR